MNNDEKMLSLIEKLYTEMNNRFNDIDKRFNSIDKQLDTLEERLTSIENTVTRIENIHGEKLSALYDAREVQNVINEKILTTLSRIEAKIDVLQMETAHIRRIK